LPDDELSYRQAVGGLFSGDGGVFRHLSAQAQSVEDLTALLTSAGER
jgi:hypothetical protein